MDNAKDKSYVKDLEKAPGASRRNSVIHLTERGKTTIEEGLEVRKEVLNEVNKDIGEENRPILKQIFADVESLGFMS